MINRRHFIALAPVAGLFELLRGSIPAVPARLREPPDDAGWDWWKNLPRTPLATSEDPTTDCLCRAAAFRNEVTILYDGGSEPGASRRIAPLGVFTVEGFSGTYVHALCHTRDAERTFRVERITSVV